MAPCMVARVVALAGATMVSGAAGSGAHAEYGLISRQAGNLRLWLPAARRCCERSLPPRWSVAAGVATRRRRLHCASGGCARATGWCHLSWR